MNLAGATEPPARREGKKIDTTPEKPGSPFTPRDYGAITQFIDDAIKGGPEGFRAAQHEANRLSRKFGVNFDTKWFICTKWLEEWASGALGTRANGLRSTNGAEQRGERDSRARVRAAIVWRSHWLCAYAMSGSKVMACRVARVGHSTADYHLKNDLDFAAQAESAKDHADDLLHTRCMQRCIEGDIEPVYWQGDVGYIRKFDTRPCRPGMCNGAQTISHRPPMRRSSQWRARPSAIEPPAAAPKRMLWVKPLADAPKSPWRERGPLVRGRSDCAYLLPVKS
jgi:hypothetical protein